MKSNIGYLYVEAVLFRALSDVSIRRYTLQLQFPRYTTISLSSAPSADTAASALNLSSAQTRAIAAYLAAGARLAA